MKRKEQVFLSIFIFLTISTLTLLLFTEHGYLNAISASREFSWKVESVDIIEENGKSYIEFKLYFENPSQYTLRFYVTTLMLEINGEYISIYDFGDLRSTNYVPIESGGERISYSSELNVSIVQKINSITTGNDRWFVHGVVKIGLPFSPLRVDFPSYSYGDL